MPYAKIQSKDLSSYKIRFLKRVEYIEQKDAFPGYKLPKKYMEINPLARSINIHTEHCR